MARSWERGVGNSPNPPRGAWETPPPHSSLPLHLFSQPLYSLSFVCICAVSGLRLGWSVAPTDPGESPQDEFTAWGNCHTLREEVSLALSMKDREQGHLAGNFVRHHSLPTFLECLSR